MTALLRASVAMLVFAAAPAGADDRFVGGPCAADADCPLAFTCEMAEVLDCEAGGGGRAGEDCLCASCESEEDCARCDCEAFEEEAGDDCAPTTELRCVFAPQPCERDADCTVPGFACRFQQECGGSECACPSCDPDDGECPPCDCEEEESGEECEAVGPGWCAPAEQSCTADADCADGWECFGADGGRGGECECTCPDCGGADCGPCECEPCEEPLEADDGVCLPPGWREQIEEWGDAGAGLPKGRNGGIEQGHFASTRSGGCSAAGAGGTGSLLLVGAALAWARRRR